MNWEIKYRKKGDNNILTQRVDLSLYNKREVQRWFMSTHSTFVKLEGMSFLGGSRQDYEFINCKEVENG